MSLRPVWSTDGVLGQTEIYSEISEEESEAWE